MNDFPQDRRYSPQELPDLRLRMTEFWDNPGNHVWVHVLDGDEDMPGQDELTDRAATVRASIAEAEMFYIDETLSHIAANSDLPIHDYGFMPWDLPAPTGFMYFDAGLRFASGDVATFALSWITHEPEDDAPHGRADLFVHAPKWAARAEMFPDHQHMPRFEQEQPDYVLANSVSVDFAEEGEDIRYVTYGGEQMSYYVRLLFATCHLIRQQIVDNDEVGPDRAARRRHQRAKLAPPAVRTVSLRRSYRPESTGESDKEWSHRWVVRGHWRRQPYKSLGIVRPIWIAPFLKGPEGAPLLGGDKVYTLTDPNGGES